jgi:M6 family metalloprotease-like protein
MDSVVGGNFGLGSDNRIGEFFTEALDQLDAEIDFTRFDNDGPDGVANSGDDDGFVDVVTFEYLEVAASCGGPSIWPHRSRMSSRTGAPYVTDDIGVGGDTIRIQDYITQGATDCTGEGVQDAAVIAHEFGHALGLPDWYHWVDSSLGPYGRRWVLGCWALMAAGSWGCGPVEDRVPFGPTNMIGFSKDYLGWIDFTDPGEVWNDTIMLGPVRTTGEALRIPMDDEGREFLIAEYRDTGGFDRYLPGEGVLLYREDTSLGIGSKPDPATDDPYPLQMLERDANNSLLEIASEGGSRGEIGDAWGVDGAAHRLTATTTPALRRASGAWSFVQIHEVSVANDSARIVLSTGRSPLALAPEGPFDVMRIRTFRAPVRVFGGVGPYTGVGTLPDGFAFESGGDELFVVGSVREESPQVFTFAVRDQNGAETGEVSITVSGSIGWAVSTARMLQRFLDSSEDPLTVGELGYLDETGNGNGRYDVGDLRAWLRENR